MIFFTIEVNAFNQKRREEGKRSVTGNVTVAKTHENKRKTYTD